MTYSVGSSCTAEVALDFWLFGNPDSSAEKAEGPPPPSLGDLTGDFSRDCTWDVGPTLGSDEWLRGDLRTCFALVGPAASGGMGSSGKSLSVVGISCCLAGSGALFQATALVRFFRLAGASTTLSRETTSSALLSRMMVTV